MTDWRHRAACLGEDGDLFFPLGDGRAYDRQVALAKSICATCPVRTDCADYALNHPELVGIWGGLDDKDRTGVRPRRMCRRCGQQPPRPGSGTHYCQPCVGKAARERRDRDNAKARWRAA